jgi:DNA replication protein DnaC
MLVNPTVEKLQQMKLGGMLKAFEEQQLMADIGHMSFDERFGLIVDREAGERKNQRFKSRLKAAKPRENACLEDIDFAPARGLNKGVILALASCDWIRTQQNVIVTGAKGVGKTYLACALLHCACREGLSARYVRVPRFLRQIAVAKIDGSYDKLMAEIARVDVVLFDDIGLAKLSGDEARDLLEIMEDRHARRSAIITSQLDPDKWYELIPDPTIADAILDRIIHRSHKIKLTGPSKRKTLPPLTDTKG